MLINREGDEFIEIGRLKVSEAIYFLLDDDNQEIILNSCNEKNNLLGYRYRQLREILVDGKKASNVIESHRENITRHLQRLYRVRNSIVHSAEAHYNINLFIKHLSDYIESTMSVVLQRLEVNDNFDNLDEVFAMIRDSVDSTIEVLGSSNDLDRDEYYKILLNGIF